LGRPRGSRNQGYEDRRTELTGRVVPRLLQPDGARVSMRELATAASVSVPTLRHYFGNRDGLLAAAMVQMGHLGANHLQRTALSEVDQPLGPSLLWWANEFTLGWTHGVGQLITMGLVTGAQNAEVGPAYINEILEPTLQAVEARLAVHRGRGELKPEVSLRHGALVLVCPILMGLIHQGPLGGSECRPLALTPFLEEHVQTFVAGWGLPGA